MCAIKIWVIFLGRLDCRRVNPIFLLAEASSFVQANAYWEEAATWKPDYPAAKGSLGPPGRWEKLIEALEKTIGLAWFMFFFKTIVMEYFTVPNKLDTVVYSS